MNKWGLINDYEKLKGNVAMNSSQNSTVLRYFDSRWCNSLKKKCFFILIQFDPLCSSFVRYDP
jgi:hypothetical protein